MPDGAIVEIIDNRVVARKINISNRCRVWVWGFPPAGVMGQYPNVVEDRPTDGGPSQPTGYRLGQCWLLPWIKYKIQGHSSYKTDVEFSMPTSQGVSEDLRQNGAQRRSEASVEVVSRIIAHGFDDGTCASLLETTVLSLSSPLNVFDSVMAHCCAQLAKMIIDLESMGEKLGRIVQGNSDGYDERHADAEYPNMV